MDQLKQLGYQPSQTSRMKTYDYVLHEGEWHPFDMVKSVTVCGQTVPPTVPLLQLVDNNPIDLIVKQRVCPACRKGSP